MTENAGHSERTAERFYLVNDDSRARMAAAATGQAIQELMAIDTVAIEEKKKA